jgi:cytochrome c oxidase assembly protein subunit 15
LVIAAAMRHNNAGLAIPAFPHATLEGAWLPAHWDFRVALAFAHRAMAVVLAVALTALASAVWRDRASSSGLKILAGVMLALVGVQIALGASVIWTGRNPYTTTAHVTVGACVLATTFLLTWWLHREKLEGGVRAKLGQPSATAAPMLAR